MLWTVLISGALLIAFVVTVVVMATPGDKSALSDTASKSWAELIAPPEPITRAELMSRYAKIAPLDRSATPETTDTLAESTCSLLEGGMSTDRQISLFTDIYHADATEVVQLLVSYKCPEFLKDFK